MRTYAEPPATFVRGEGTAALRRRRDGATSTSSPGWPWSRSATPTRRWPRRWPSRPARCATCRTSTATRWPPRWRRTLDRLVNGGTGQAGGQVFFCNSGAEANECALKLARRWAGDGRHVVVSAENSFHGRTLATLTATGQPEKHAPFRPLPEGFVHVPYDDLAALDAALDPGRGGRRPARAPPGRGRGGGAELGLPGRGARAVHRAQRPAHARRGADRPRAHRPLVRLPGPGARARRGHDGQGARQRDAGRRLLGPGRGGGRVRTGRPRLDVRRPAPGPGRRPGHARHHGGRGRLRPGPARRGPA